MATTLAGAQQTTDTATGVVEKSEALAKEAVGEVTELAGEVAGEIDSLAHTMAPYVAPVAATGFGYLFHLLEQQPFLFIFIALAIGYPLGSLKFKGVGLGSTAGTLVVGLLLSLTAFLAFDIQFKLPGLVSTIFLSMFMYALGLKVGPSFFPGLKRGGLGLVLIGVIAIVANFIIAFGGAKLVGLEPGYAAGLISGSYTVTAVIGVATSAMQGGAWSPPQGMSTDQVSANIAAGYAISYVLSTIGIILLIKYLPQIFGDDPVAKAKEAEAALGGGADATALPGTEGAFVMGPLPIDIRTYRVEHEELAGQSVGQLFEKFPHAAVLRVVRGDQVLEAADNPTLRKDDVIAVRGRYGNLISKAADVVGTEVDEPRARDIEVTTAELHIGKGGLGGKTITELAKEIGFGLYLKALFRQGQELPKLPETKVEVGDVLRVAGPDWCIQKAAEAFKSKPIRLTTVTEVLYMAIAMVIGYVVGLLSVTLGGIPFALGTSAGCMLSGIMFATLRTWNPAFGGPVSEGARSFLQDIGLNVFIAVLAANVGSKVIASFQGATVIWLAIIGTLAALVPPFLSFLYGHYVMKMNSVVLAGACAGARNSTPSLQALSEQAQSSVGAIPYPVTYALTSALVLISGYLAMILS
jgi:putative transport protein